MSLETGLTKNYPSVLEKYCFLVNFALCYLKNGVEDFTSQSVYLGMWKPEPI